MRVVPGLGIKVKEALNPETLNIDKTLNPKRLNPKP